MYMLLPAVVVLTPTHCRTVDCPLQSLANGPAMTTAAAVVAVESELRVLLSLGINRLASSIVAQHAVDCLAPNQ